MYKDETLNNEYRVSQEQTKIQDKTEYTFNFEIVRQKVINKPYRQIKVSKSKKSQVQRIEAVTT